MSQSAKNNDEMCRSEAHGEPVVLHCHHYNTFLQQSIQDATYVDSRRFLVGAANEVAFAQLRQAFEENGVDGVDARKDFAETLYREAGFGVLSLAKATETGGVVNASHSHYSSAWKAKFGASERPVDVFTTGWISGALAAIYGTVQGHYDVTQEQCMAMGAEANSFQVGAGKPPSYALYSSPGMGNLGAPGNDVPLESNVDPEGIRKAVLEMNLTGDSSGEISAFGVYLSRHYANYYNRVSFEFLREMVGRFGENAVEIVSPLLIEAGHVCAFNTLGGVMLSTEWEALIQPQVKSTQDRAEAVLAVINALGWGRWTFRSFSESEAVIALAGDYESSGHLAAYGQATYPVTFLAQGAAIGVMNLLFRGELEKRPTFDNAFYQKLFKGAEGYDCEELSSRARGDEQTLLRVFRR